MSLFSSIAITTSANCIGARTSCSQATSSFPSCLIVETLHVLTFPSYQHSQPAKLAAMSLPPKERELFFFIHLNRLASQNRRHRTLRGVLIASKREASSGQSVRRPRLTSSTVSRHCLESSRDAFNAQTRTRMVDVVKGPPVVATNAVMEIRQLRAGADPNILSTSSFIAYRHRHYFRNTPSDFFSFRQ